MRARETVEILVVEDEDGIRLGLCDLLVFHGYHPTAAATGDRGLELALGGRYDLILLDVMLPGIDGFEICRRVRAAREAQPILMLTAKGAEEDIVQGFRAGCDDYVPKPFSLRELLARIEALLRRARGRVEEPEAFDFVGWRVDPAGLVACRGEEVVDLTRREVHILALLQREEGRIVSRRSLLKEVWGMENVEQIQTRTVDMHIAKLRKKLDPTGSLAIETVRGEGYRFGGHGP